MMRAPAWADPARIGGSHATHRHFFTLSAAVPAPIMKRRSSAQNSESPLSPPPKRILAEGVPSTPRLSETEAETVRAKLREAVDVLALELEAVKAEADMVSPEALRAEPDLYKTIAVIGPVFSPGQVRNQVVIDARAIGSVADRLLTRSSVRNYLTEEQKSALSTIISDAQALSTYMGQFSLEPVADELSAALSEEHVQTHIREASRLIGEAERAIVSAEAKAVPVLEPGEKTTGTLGAILALATLVAVGIFVAEYA